MSEHYDFHYQPTGSGAISGQQVLEQTEDAINELGDYVYDNVGGAMDVAQEALETAQNAEQDAQTALDTANSFSSAIQSAQQDASTALSTAQTAQTTASNANNTAIQAQQDASSAVTTANNASSQVSTLSGTVTALGQRVTTAEGNIGQNTSDITALTTRVGTAEGNITTLQNDVTIAQGNASSAMATAGQVKQQAFVFRYSSTALVASSTNSNTLLDNTDNLKVGDKVIDSNGVLFSITAIDTQNSTFTIGTSLIDLAQDSDVVHKSGDETVGGVKTFSSDIIRGTVSNNTTIQKKYIIGNYTASTTGSDSNSWLSISATLNYSDGTPSKTASVSLYVVENAYSTGKFSAFRPNSNNLTDLGTNSKRWANVYATNYYYGTNNVEFSTKFVTTDTNQTISGNKTFSEDIVINNSDTSQTTKRLVITSSKVNLGDANSDSWGISFNAGSSYSALINSKKSTSSTQDLQFTVRTKDTNNALITADYRLRVYTDGTATIEPTVTDYISLGSSSNKWKDVQSNRFNGLEPSSLSLPSDRSARIDISSYITNLGNGNNNSYTVSANGYIYLYFTSINGVVCFSQTSGGLTNYAQTFTRYQGEGVLYAFFPVRKDDVFVVQIYTSSTAVVQSAYFIPCQGNV